MSQDSINIQEIYKYISDSYDIEDLDILCYCEFGELQKDFSNSDNIKIRTKKLIDYCKNRGRIEELLDILKRDRPNQFENYQDIVKRKLYPNQNGQKINNITPRNIVRRIPYHRNINFMGREIYLETLRELLQSGSPVAIIGLGGMGKTQLAIEYTYRSIETNDYDLIWYMQSDNIGVLKSQYSDLAQKLGLRKRNESSQRIEAEIEAVRDWLETHDRWLLVFDNVQNPNDVDDLLPYLSKGHIIVTSRHQKWGSVAKKLLLKKFPRSESIDFLLERSGKREDEAADVLAHELGDLPLALEHACAYIETNGITIQDYVFRFQKYQTKLFQKIETSKEYPLTVAKTWEISLNQIKDDSPISVELLKLCAFLAPENIPKSLLLDGMMNIDPTNHEKDIVLDRAIGGLKTYSLIEVDNTSISIHRLVQAVTRDSLANEEQRKWIAYAVQMVYNDFSFIYPKRLELKPHASTSLEHAEDLGLVNTCISNLSNMIKGFTLFNEGDTVSATQLFSIILNHDPHNNEVRFYRGLCYLRRGKGFAQSAIMDLKSVLGSNEDLDKHVALGKAYYRKGRIDLAEKEAYAALKPGLPKKLFDEVDAKILKAKCRLTMEDYDGAIDILKVLPQNNVSVINTHSRALVGKGKLAATHEDKLQEYTRAIYLLDKAIKQRPYIPTFYHFRAKSLVERNEPGDWERAVKDWDTAAKINPKDNKPWEERGNLLYRIAVEMSKGMQKDELLIEALWCYERALDLASPWYKPTLRNMRALIFQLQGKFEAGIEETKKSINENPEFVQNYMACACASIAAFEWSEVIAAANKGLTIAKKRRGAANIWLLLFRIIGRSGDHWNLHYIMQDFDRLIEAKKDFKEFKANDWEWPVAKERTKEAMKAWPIQIAAIVEKSINIVEGNLSLQDAMNDLDNIGSIYNNCKT